MLVDFISAATTSAATIPPDTSSSNWLTFLAIIIGPISILATVLLTQFFKDKERESLFSGIIFERKLGIYEDLYHKMETIYSEGISLAENKDLTKKERKEKWSESAISLAEFLDNNGMYINRDIQIHCTITVIGIEDIADLPEKKKKDALKKFNDDRYEAERLIKEDIGVKRIEKFLSNINKPELTSRHIEYFNKLRKEKKRDS